MIFVFLLFDRYDRSRKLYETLDLELSAKEVEYGSALRAKDLVKTHIGDLNVNEDFDPFKTGPQTVTYTLSKEEDRYRHKVTREFTFDIEVKDTKTPLIELQEEEVYVYVGSGYDPLDNVTDAYDTVDGKIEDVTIEGDYDLDRPGTYEIKAAATDRNGLKSEMPFILHVKNRPVSGAEGYDIIYRHLRETYGYNKAAACGILANIRFESNFDPDIGDYYYGLCQWGGSRKNNLFSYCEGNGLDASSIEGQLAYLDHEMNVSYAGVKEYLQNIEDSSSGAYGAAEYFCRHFEGAASSEGRGDLAVSYYIS
ncbi:MAG: hypothetical protein K5648_10265 [Erysipelotrichaceae bacterium]|nr:hypothetical protein [Erysipelotrichaceae bacterium]